ncbi:hypothetical protein [Bifidobacterium bombi]|uniref:Uncharacterized protein n=1 Tax=Bifidobacterium bombi DSM 19703 TaxID=1341695 RepID=A0A080N2Y3_9BIFI|nr:hypothetical protein [Bifidobacterium bombi]KFF31433.1 hypothetical protein BBOMB_0787 [Bifidobacterium bombi DSM 19703]
MNGTVHESLVTVTSVEHRGALASRMRVTHVETSDSEDLGDECFDLDSCCDAAERAMIERLRQVLRPVAVPAGLLDRIEATLDRCCLDESPNSIRNV